MNGVYHQKMASELFGAGLQKISMPGLVSDQKQPDLPFTFLK